MGNAILNPGWREGTIGIPTQGTRTDQMTICHYYIKCFETESLKGIDGGKIESLIINLKNQTTCYYADGRWQIGNPTCNYETKVAYEILLKEYN